VPVNDSSTIQFWCAINKNELSLSDYFNDSSITYINKFIKPVGINISQIAAHCNGEVSFEKRKDTLRTEKIVTYEFDDDFNKIKKESLLSSSELCFSGHLGCENDDIFNYLIKTKKIKTDKQEQILSSVPVARVRVLNDKNNLFFCSPAMNKSELMLKQDSTSFFFKTSLKEFFKEALPFPLADLKTIEIQMMSQDSLTSIKGKVY
jgi:hypothetical protein